MSDIPRAVVYAWDPRELAEGGRGGADRQVQACRWWGREHGVDVVLEYVDYGQAFSWPQDRPEFQRLLGDAETLLEYDVTAVLVADFCRIGPCRAMRDPALTALRELGVAVHSIDRAEFRVPWR